MILSEVFSGTTLIIIALVFIVVWVLLEIKRFKHKIFLISFVVLIVFLYIGVIVVLQDKQVDLKSISGIMGFTKIYFSWLGSILGNLKLITSNVVQMNWFQNITTTNGNV